MKLHRLLLSSILLFVVSITIAQVPQGFSYQAIARDNSANPIVSTALTIETGVLSDTVANIYLWKETHAVTTNQFGLFGLTVGQGTKTGGTASTLNDINWAAAPLYIRTKVYYQSAWRDMGAARLWSVPSAMVAQKALAVTGDPVMINGGAVYILNNVGIGTNTPGTTKLAVMGDDAQSADALFEVKRKDGEVIFAVYNHGVRVNVPVDTLTKARKGGFAIGGFDKTKGFTQDYFVVSPDSIRAYFDDTPAVKGTKGGFAIGGFDVAKGSRQPYMVVSTDSVRLYIDETPIAKGPKGGFAIGGFDNTKKAPVINFTLLTPKNYFIGHNSGKDLTSGLYNLFMGYNSGVKTTTGNQNIFLGFESGFSNTSGYNNVFVGNKSGYSNTIGVSNVFIGDSAGYKNFDGNRNVIIGDKAGVENTTGYRNVFIGSFAGNANTTGHSNTFIQTAAGITNTTGIGNVYIGRSAGYEANGNYNLFIGYQPGLSNFTGNDNIFLGYRAGFVSTGSRNIFLGKQAGGNKEAGDDNLFIGNGAGSQEPGSWKLYIENSNVDSTMALIYGNFTTDFVRINNRLGIGRNPVLQLEVNGEASKTIAGTWLANSDIRIKRDIADIENAIETIMNLHPIKFRYSREWLETNPIIEDRIYYNFIAQEYAKVFPESVKPGSDFLKGDNEGLLQLDAWNAQIIAIKAIQEQQALINSLLKEGEIRQKLIEDMATRLAALEAAVNK